MWVWPVWDDKKLNLIINFALDIRVGVSYRKVKLEMLLELILCRSLRKDVAGRADWKGTYNPSKIFE